MWWYSICGRCCGPCTADLQRKRSQFQSNNTHAHNIDFDPIENLKPIARASNTTQIIPPKPNPNLQLSDSSQWNGKQWERERERFDLWLFCRCQCRDLDLSPFLLCFASYKEQKIPREIERIAERESWLASIRKRLKKALIFFFFVFFFSCFPSKILSAVGSR